MFVFNNPNPKGSYVGDCVVRAITYSYARGRGRNARRDSMGRYSNRYDDRGYSRHDAKEELAMDLKELKMDAKDDETKRMIDRWIKQLEQD